MQLESGKKEHEDKDMIIGGKEFAVGQKTYVMGILNITPDSFSDGGRYDSVEQAMRHAEEMLKAGADIVDVGGESTRPGHVQISDEEEIARVVPVIEKIKRSFDIPVSVDTYKSAVAKASLDAGADLINDIWGLKYDEKMAEVIANANAVCCLMHNRNEAVYADFMPDLLSDLRESVSLAKAAGIRDENIILDPGVGFGKTYEMNLEVIKNLAELHQLSYPVLLGTSRKSVIGLTLDVLSDQREEGTQVTTVMAVQSGCTFVRVHDVLGNKRAIQMTEAILRNHDLTHADKR